MKLKILALELVRLFFTLFMVSFLFSQNTVSTSKIWYASLLKKYFPRGISIHGINYPLDTIPCLSKDITKFNVTAEKVNIGLGPALQIIGTLKLGKIEEPFSVIDGAKGNVYMLHLQAYLFSPSGVVTWQQKGFPVGDSWVSAAGDKVEFRLINAFNRSITGCVLLIIAAGDPILSDYDEIRVILGVKKINL